MTNDNNTRMKRLGYTMDTIIKADETLCIHCGSCIRACPGGLITKDKFPVPIPDSWDLCIDWMKIIKEKNPALYEEANLEVFVDAWDGGEDRISRGAPCIIIACAPKDERTAPPAAMIAIAYAQVAAAGLGLGATFTGSINTAAQSYPPLIELLDLPDGHVPHGTFVLGYPAEQYHRIPTRKPLEVSWR